MSDKPDVIRMLSRVFVVFIIFLMLSGSTIVQTERSELQKEIDREYSGSRFWYHPELVARLGRQADLIVKAWVASDLSDVDVGPPKFLLEMNEVCFSVSAVAKGNVPSKDISVFVRISALPFPGSKINWVEAVEERHDDWAAQRSALRDDLSLNQEAFDMGDVTESVYVENRESLSAKLQSVPWLSSVSDLDYLSHTAILDGHEYILFLTRNGDGSYEILAPAFYEAKKLTELQRALSSTSSPDEEKALLEFHPVDASDFPDGHCKIITNEVDNHVKDARNDFGSRYLHVDDRQDERDLDESSGEPTEEGALLLEKTLVSAILYRDAGHVIDVPIKYSITQKQVDLAISSSGVEYLIFNLGLDVSLMVNECNGEKRVDRLRSYARNMVTIKNLLFQYKTSEEFRQLFEKVVDPPSFDVCAFASDVVDFTQQ
ncbi:hypothetical protein [uncultured Gilvimarinus sp.]|uniref:hypothetical protein n=1 Tax=uncultured Gilvimarinus sp. TaxID=1689143 RepID=UPI0030D77EAF